MLEIRPSADGAIGMDVPDWVCELLECSGVGLVKCRVLERSENDE